MPFVLPSMMAVKLSGRTSAQAVLVATRVRSRDCWGVFTGRALDRGSPAFHSCSSPIFRPSTFCHSGNRTGQSRRRLRFRESRKNATWSALSFPAPASGEILFAALELAVDFTRQQTACSDRSWCRRA